MGCTSCATSNGLPKGCKNNGACGVSGCNKLEVFDWLANMRPATGKRKDEYVEVRFKNERKEYFVNPNNLSLHMGDVVAVESNPGHDIGVVTLTGELVKVQLRKKKLDKKMDALSKVYRKASERDIEKWKENRAKEEEFKLQARKIAFASGLAMKIGDVEIQADGSKAIFYYTANKRIDFRNLVRQFADVFKLRIEMRQIGSRQEAAKIGGIGSCGRELCCSTWLTDFRSVNVNAARYQQLSINPTKLAGQCGKLKCCLNYELDSYIDALKAFPKMNTTIQTKTGKASIAKIDVFKELVWLSPSEPELGWVEFDLETVKGMIAKNKAGEKVDELIEVKKATEPTESKKFKDLLGENSLERFDHKRKKRKSKKKKPRNPQSTNQNSQQKPPRKGKNPRNKKPRNNSRKGENGKS